MSGSDVKKQVLRARKQEVEQGLKDAMSTRQGRLFLWDLLEGCGVFRTSFDPVTPHVTNFNEGSRNEGLKLLARIAAANPDGLALLMRENTERVGQNERRQHRDDDSGRGDGSGGDAAGG